MGQSFLEPYRLCVARVSVSSPNLFRPLKGKELRGLMASLEVILAYIERIFYHPEDDFGMKKG